MFSFICALPSPASAAAIAALFGWFTGVGSEVAHQVSMLATVRRPNRACSFPAHGFHEDSTSRGRKRRNQSDQIYQPELTIEHRLWQLLPTTVAPAQHPREQLQSNSFETLVGFALACNAARKRLR